MGKVDRLRNIVEPFDVLLPCPASLHRRTESISLYGQIWFNSQQRRASPPYPPVLFKYVICLVWESLHGGIKRTYYTYIIYLQS